MSRDEVTTRRRTGYCLLTFVNSGEGVKGMENWGGYPLTQPTSGLGNRVELPQGSQGSSPGRINTF